MNSPPILSIEFSKLIAVLSRDTSVNCPTAQLAKAILHHCNAEAQSEHAPSLQVTLTHLNANYGEQDEALRLELDQCKIARDKLRGELHRLESQIEHIEARRKEVSVSRTLCTGALAAMAADPALANGTAIGTSKQLLQQGTAPQAPANQQQQPAPPAQPLRWVGSSTAKQGHQSDQNQVPSKPPPPQPAPEAHPGIHTSSQPQPKTVAPREQHVDVDKPVLKAQVAPPSQVASLREIEATLNLLQVPDVKESTLMHGLSQCETYCLSNSESPWASRGEYDVNLQLAAVLFRHLPLPRPPIQIVEVRVLASIAQRFSTQALPSFGAAAIESEPLMMLPDVVLSENGFGALARLLTSVNDEVKSETLHTLSKLVNDGAMRTAFREAGGVDPLALIVTKSTSEPVLERALTLLWNLAPDDHIKAEFRMAGGLAGCTELLFTDSLALLENNIISLVFLTRDPESAALMGGGNFGGLEKLVSTLHHPNPEIQAKAAAVVWNCASVDSNRTALRELGAFPVLVQLLTSPNETAQENAAGALWNLTVEPHTDNRTAIFEYGGLPVLISLLSVSHRPSIIDNTAGTLWNLSSNVDCRAAIRKWGGLTPLLQLLTHPMEGIQEKAAGTLRNCALNDQNKSAIREAGGIDLMVARLLQAGPSVVDKLLSALWMTTVVPENKHAVRNCGGFPVFAALLSSSNRQHLSSPSSVEKALAVLRNCSMIAENRAPMVEAGIIAAIVSLFELSTHAPRAGPRAPSNLCEIAASTIWHLGRDDKVAGRTQGGLQLVCSMLCWGSSGSRGASSGTPPAEFVLTNAIMEQAAGAISSLTISSPENKDFIRTSGALAVLANHIIKTGSGDASAVLQATPAMYALQNVLIALRNCTSGCEPNQRDLCERGLVSSLLDVSRKFSQASRPEKPSAASVAIAGTSVDDITREAILCLKNLSSDRKAADEVLRLNGLATLTLLQETGATEAVRKAAAMALQSLTRSIPSARPR